MCQSYYITMFVLLNIARVFFDNRVDEILIQSCKEISKRHEINVLEIGTDDDLVHFLI